MAMDVIVRAFDIDMGHYYTWVETCAIKLSSQCYNRHAEDLDCFMGKSLNTCVASWV